MIAGAQFSVNGSGLFSEPAQLPWLSTIYSPKKIQKEFGQTSCFPQLFKALTPLTYSPHFSCDFSSNHGAVSLCTVCSPTVQMSNLPQSSLPSQFIQAFLRCIFNKSRSSLVRKNRLVIALKEKRKLKKGKKGEESFISILFQEF